LFCFCFMFLYTLEFTRVAAEKSAM
jgi:hypothetical protein